MGVSGVDVIRIRLYRVSGHARGLKKAAAKGDKKDQKGSLPHQKPPRKGTEGTQREPMGIQRAPEEASRFRPRAWPEKGRGQGRQQKQKASQPHQEPPWKGTEGTQREPKGIQRAPKEATSFKPRAWPGRGHGLVTARHLEIPPPPPPPPPPHPLPHTLATLAKIVDQLN